MKIFKEAPKKEIHLFFIMAFFQICGLFGILFLDRELTLSLTPQNLLITTFCIIFIYPKKKKIFLFFIISFLIGFSFEALGVNYGLIFGNYTYGNVLGYKIFGVPIMIGINWFFLSICCGGISDKVFNGTTSRLILGSLLMVLIDIMIEPLAPILDFWEFNGGTAPIQNYIGWFTIAFFIQYIYQKMTINFSPIFSILVFGTQMGFFILLMFLI